MNLSSLDLNLLVALDALLDEASVSRAAARVSLSQPAMSHALKRLRILLADPLLVRTGPHMHRTARGDALRTPVRDVLSRVRDLVASNPFDPTTSTRTFRLFVADNAADLLLPLLLRRLAAHAPHVSIQVHSTVSHTLDPVELSHAVDAAVACVPHRFTGFYQQRLFTDRDACAVRRAHPLTRRLTHLDTFLTTPHVAVVAREFAEDPVDTWLRDEGHARHIALTVPHYLQALHLVAQSDLIAVLPERLIRAYAAALDLRVVPVPLDVGTFDEYLLHPARTHTDPGCVWLRGILLATAKSLKPLPL